MSEENKPSLADSMLQAFTPEERYILDQGRDLLRKSLTVENFPSLTPFDIDALYPGFTDLFTRFVRGMQKISNDEYSSRHDSRHD